MRSTNRSRQCGGNIPATVDAALERHVGHSEFFGPRDNRLSLTVEREHVGTGFVLAMGNPRRVKSNFNRCSAANATLERSVVDSQMRGPVNECHRFAVKGKDLASAIDAPLLGLGKSDRRGDGLGKGHFSSNYSTVQREILHPNFFGPRRQSEFQSIVIEMDIGVHVTGLFGCRRPFHVSRLIAFGAVDAINRMPHRRARRHILNEILVGEPSLANGNRIPGATTIDIPVFKGRIDATPDHHCPDVAERVSFFEICHTILFTLKTPASLWLAFRVIDIFWSKLVSVLAMGSCLYHKKHCTSSKEACKQCL